MKQIPKFIGWSSTMLIFGRGRLVGDDQGLEAINKPDKYKEIIISSWQELTERQMIMVYGLVIMPNHLYVVWEMKEPNGKEIGTPTALRTTVGLRRIFTKRALMSLAFRPIIWTGFNIFGSVRLRSVGT